MITKTRGGLKGVVSVGLEPWTTELITKTWGRSLSVVGAATNNFVMTKVLLQQAYFCHNKHVFCCDKNVLVMTKLVTTKVCLSWQNFYCNKHTFVATKDMFVTTKVCLSQQCFCCDKIMLWQIFVAVTNICCNKPSVMTQMILVAAPASDVLQSMLFLLGWNHRPLKWSQRQAYSLCLHYTGIIDHWSDHTVEGAGLWVHGLEATKLTAGHLYQQPELCAVLCCPRVWTSSRQMFLGSILTKMVMNPRQNALFYLMCWLARSKNSILTNINTICTLKLISQWCQFWVKEMCTCKHFTF